MAASGRSGTAAALELAVRPPSPFRLRGGGADRTMPLRDGVVARLLHVEGSPVLARAWQLRGGELAVRAEAVDPRAVHYPLGPGLATGGALGRRGHGAPSQHGASPPEAPPSQAPPAGTRQLALAVERLRFALGVDLELGDFQRRFRRDPLLGPLLRRLPAYRPRRPPLPWEALQTAIVKQLIESERAALIERRIAARWGPRLGAGRGALRDVPSAAAMAGRAPAELESMDLAGSRAVALRRVAREVASGRCDPADPAADARLRAISQIGPWTVQCLALYGRGELDALPAGDLAYLKLVGRLAGLGRRATIAEVEEFYAPYEPYRGLAGTLSVAGLWRTVAQGPPLRIAA